MCTPTHRRVAPPIAAPLFGNVNFLHVFKSITKMVLSNNSSDLDVCAAPAALPKLSTSERFFRGVIAHSNFYDYVLCDEII